jgi:biopolymer transport protein ExbD
MKAASLIGVSFLFVMGAIGLTKATYAADSGAVNQAVSVVFMIDSDGSYSFQGKSIDEATLKARLMVFALLAPQPPVQVVLKGNGAAAQRALQQLKSDAVNAGIANIVVNR